MQNQVLPVQNIQVDKCVMHIPTVHSDRHSNINVRLICAPEMFTCPP